MILFESGGIKLKQLLVTKFRLWWQQFLFFSHVKMLCLFNKQYLDMGDINGVSLMIKNWHFISAGVCQNVMSAWLSSLITGARAVCRKRRRSFFLRIQMP